MANIILPPRWRIPESQATPEDIYWRRREFVRALGIGAAALGSGACGSSFVEADPPVGGGGVGCDADPPTDPLQTICASPAASLYPAARNSTYGIGSREVTDRVEAATHNNYYEFIGRAFDINKIWDLTGPFRVRPWTIEVAGLVENPTTWDADALEQEFGLEERLYRLRCVEAWSIAVPWMGYPLRRLIEKARPLSSANYVAFLSFNRPDEAIGQETQPQYPWPYYEALRLDEAMNDLAFGATGVYGEPLPKQHGAPLRLAVPWKYGFKSAKAFVRMEFMEFQPTTFWSDLDPVEYGFYSNVNPDVDHPRWSQARERHIPDTVARPTQLFNGYGEFVADLYDPELLTYRS